MNLEDRNPIQASSALMLLSFWVMGVRLAVDAREVREICRPADVHNRNFRIVHIPEKMSFTRQGSGYLAPRILIPKADAPAAGLEVDCLENVMSVDMENIFPLPPLVARFHPTMTLWGVAVTKNGLVPLLDLFRLLAGANEP